MKDNLKFGADPEFFASYEMNGERYVLPPVVLRTDFDCEYKENDRHPIFAEYGKTVIHEDGAAFEASTPPNADWKEIWNTLDEAKKRFSADVLSKYSDVCTPQLFSIPSMKYEVERWYGRGPEFQMATLFGCDADIDAFNTEVPCRTLDASLHPWRYAGGHIHFSGIPEVETMPLIAIKSMAMTAGLAATAFSDMPDLERERIFLYGKPGKYRPQKYPNGEVGIEYRTPSTRWTENYSLAEQVFTWATVGIRSLLQGKLFSELEPVIMNDTRKAITEVDQPLAHQLLDFISSKV